MPQTQHQHHTQHHTHSLLRAPLTRTDLIRALDQEVDRLLQAKHLLANTTRPEPAATEMDIAVNTLSLVARPDAGKITNVRAGRAGRAKRKLSAAARQRISEAQTARWKKFHQQQGKKKKLEVA